MEQLIDGIWFDMDHFGDDAMERAPDFRATITSFLEQFDTGEKRGVREFRNFEGLSLDDYVLNAAIVSREELLAISKAISTPELRGHASPYIFFPIPVEGNHNLMRSYYGVQRADFMERYALPSQMVITPELSAAVWNRHNVSFVPLVGPRLDRGGTRIPDRLDDRIKLMGPDERSIPILYAVKANDPNGAPYSAENPDPVKGAISRIRQRRTTEHSELEGDIERAAQAGVETAEAVSREYGGRSEEDIRSRQASEQTISTVGRFIDHINNVADHIMRSQSSLSIIEDVVSRGNRVYERLVRSIRDEKLRDRAKKILGECYEKMIYTVAILEYMRQNNPELGITNQAVKKAAVASYLSDIGLIPEVAAPPHVRALKHHLYSEAIVNNCGLEQIANLVARSHCFRDGDMSQYYGLSPEQILRQDLSTTPLGGVDYKSHQVVSLIGGMVDRIIGLLSPYFNEYGWQRLSLFEAMRFFSEARSGQEDSSQYPYDADVVRAAAEMTHAFPPGSSIDIRLRSDRQGTVYAVKDPRKGIERTNLVAMDARALELPDLSYGVVTRMGTLVPFGQSLDTGRHSRLTDTGSTSFHSVMMYGRREGDNALNAGKFNKDVFEGVHLRSIPQETNGA